MRLVDALILTGPGTVVRGELAWSNETGLITYLGPTRGPRQAGDLDGAGRLALPGLVNGHTHAAMSMLRGYCDDLPLHIWLQRMREVEIRMTAADIAASLRLAMAEMMRSGTTGFVDMFGWNVPLLAEVVQAGMRVNAAPTVFGYDSVAFPAADPGDGAAVLDGTPALAKEFAGEGRITVSYGLHAPYTCPGEMISDVAARRAGNGIAIQIHLSETRREVEESEALHGVSPIRRVADLGLMSGRVHVAHAVHPRAGDTELLAGAEITVSHNPVSNLKLGAGVAPVPGYLAAGVRLGLGTDSVASNNTLDLFEEIKTAAILHRGVSENPQALLAGQALALATQGSAQALDQGLSGRLEVGAAADIVLLNVAGTTAVPLTDAVSFAVFAARGTDVTDVFVAGRQVVRDGRCLTIDEPAARAEVVERSARIRAEIASH